MTERDKLIVDNIRLAQSIAWSFAKSWKNSSFDDILSAAKIGLVKAADNWLRDEPEAKFSTYAYSQIRWSIHREYRDTLNFKAGDCWRTKQRGEKLPEISHAPYEERNMDGVEDRNYKTFENHVDARKLVATIKNKKERMVMELRLDGMSSVEIAKSIKRSKGRVDQIVKDCTEELTRRVSMATCGVSSPSRG